MRITEGSSTAELARAAARDAVAWVMAQPPDRFAIDAQCLVVESGLAPEPPWLRPTKLELVHGARLPEGGYESKYGGGEPSVLWTADAARRLHLDGDARWLAPALRWLEQRQLRDGSWVESDSVPWARSWYRAPRAHVWITAAVAQSLCNVMEAAALTARAMTFLERGAGRYGSLAEGPNPELALRFAGFDLFSTAVVVDLYRLVRRPFPAAATAAEHLLARQEPDGSWEQATDPTQAVLGALVQLGHARRPEVAAAVRALTRWRNEDGSFTHRPGDPGDWTLTAYTARTLHRYAVAMGDDPATADGTRRNR
ncbi:prenyltransferase/squalene oxidase repeat-containing protein [Streptomyces sp. NPDC052107]|uniref:prenyltransferase/squalene oxidase repeat-containing protein n=1 Tax=Streptomyces sp. NPDC052107 TaxID=3155632 RepID=UPI003443E6E3